MTERGSLMPSAKSQKLADLGEPDVLCAVCRQPWSRHLRKKDGKVMQKYRDHHPTGGGSMRPYRSKTGVKKKSMSQRKKPPASLHLSIMRDRMTKDG